MKRKTLALLLVFFARTAVSLAQAPPAGRKLETAYLTIRIAHGWRVQGSENQVNLVYGKYRLCIEPVFEHASGVVGGRFPEIGCDMQSIYAVAQEAYLLMTPSDCAEWPPEKLVVSQKLSLINLYTDPSKVGNACNFPPGTQPVWFGSYFQGEGPSGDYAITLTYQLDRPEFDIHHPKPDSDLDLSALPKKGSPELQRVFRDVQQTLNSMQLKPRKRR